MNPFASPSSLTAPLNILLVENHSLFREGLAHVLAAQPDLKIVGEAGTVQEAIEAARRLKPNMVLMDLGLPDGSGVDAIRTIRAEQPAVLAICLTVNDDDETVLAALHAGAHGYVFKNIRAADLLKTIRGVALGEAGLSRTLTRRVLDSFSRQPHPPHSLANPPEDRGLTPRETELIRLMACGATNRQIAERLVISEHTVRNHVHNVLQKLGLHSRRDVASLVKVEGLLSAVLLGLPVHVATHAPLWTSLGRFLSHLR
jgi:DNA-binding NarL/FixJ family response regulator